MEKKDNIFLRKWKTKLIIGLVSLAISLIFLFLYLYVWKKPTIVAACDITIILAAIFLGIGGLMIIAHFGMFDTLAYGFNSLGHYVFNSKKAPKYVDLIDYRDKKNISRSQSSHFYFPFLINGIIYLIACGVCEIILHTVFKV